VTETLKLLKKIISGRHKIYPRVEKLALIKGKSCNFTVYKVDNKTFTDFKNWWHKNYKHTFLQRNVAVKSFQNIKKLLPKQ
jgi:hypothetical protein